MKKACKELTDKLKNKEITVAEYNKLLKVLIEKDNIKKYGIASGKIKGKRTA
jgi:hypothetical protein